MIRIVGGACGKNPEYLPLPIANQHTDIKSVDGGVTVNTEANDSESSLSYSLLSSSFSA